MTQEETKVPEAEYAVAERSKIADATLSATEIALDPSTYKLKAYLAGPSGSGKTQSAITIPGRKLLIDYDNRAHTVVGTPNLEILDCYEEDPRSPKAWRRAEDIKKQIAREINKGIFPYDAVIQDGMTMMGRISLNWALLLDPKRGLGGAPARQHYLPQMDNLAKHILTSLTWPIHVIYTGHIELIEDEDEGRSRFYPKITGKLRTEVSNWFNETYFCYRQMDRTEPDKPKLKYYWMTAGSGRMEFFKSSLNSLGRFWTDPIELDFEADGPVGFADLLERRFGNGQRKQTT